MAQQQYQGEPLTGPLAITVTFNLPTNHAKRWGLPHVFRPDVDNLQKGVFDALHGICWKDDCQIATLMCEKRWAEQGSIVLTCAALEGTEPARSPRAHRCDLAAIFPTSLTQIGYIHLPRWRELPDHEINQQRLLA